VTRLALVFAAALLSGCGGTAHGTATLWVTRDRGMHVVLAREVPAGLTAMQALDRVADIETRYGGRYVQSIGGVGGSLAKRRDWFYFINGYEGDRSAAEYRLHVGDVEWWDFRSWKTRMRQPVVVGTFPEPFLHGYNGKRRPARVLYFTAGQRRDAEALARLLHGQATKNVFGAEGLRANLLVLGRGAGVSFTTGHAAATRPGDPVAFLFIGNPKLLLASPPFGHHRYEVRP
jgi:hypothetical protein